MASATMPMIEHVVSIDTHRAARHQARSRAEVYRGARCTRNCLVESTGQPVVLQ